MRGATASLTLAVVLAAADARAEGRGPVDARTVASAGAGVVVADGAGGLLLNPAGLGRRPTFRVQLGLALTDDHVHYDATDSPTVRDQAGPTLLPVGAAQLGLGERLVIGVAWIEPWHHAFAVAESPVYDQPVVAESALYPSRYAPTRLELRDQGVAAGVAALPLPWLSIGAAVTARRVTADWASTLWGGDDTVVTDLDPGYDMRATVDGEDGFVPGVVAGVVIAPPSLPVELGAAVTWSADATIEGEATLRDSRARTTVTNTALVEARPFGRVPATLLLPAPLVVRGGLRTFVDRLAIEVDGELRLHGDDGAPRWRTVAPFELRRTETGDQATVSELPLGAVPVDSWSVRGALELDVVPDFVLLIAGYGYDARTVRDRDRSPALPGLPMHTAAAGLEARVAGHTATLGGAYSFASPSTGAAEDVTVLAPFDDRAHAAAAGRVGASTLTLALTLEKEW